MNDFQVLAHIQRTPSGPLIDFHLPAALLGRMSVPISFESGSQPFQELLVWFGEAIVEFVAGCPERITPIPGYLTETQGGERRGAGLELPICMPQSLIKASCRVLQQHALFVIYSIASH